MRLLHPHLLWLLLLVPAAVLAYAIALVLRRRALARLGNPLLIARMSAGTSVPRKVARAVLVCLALGLLALSLTRPQAGGRARLEKARGLDLVVALDFSKSMLAKDIYPSRLERAKRELESLLEHLAGDRVGLVAFAGETLSYPPTTDYDALKLFWRDLSPADLPVGGTAIGRALTSANDMLARLRAAGGKTRDQVILLLTDGEETESQPLDAADAAAKLGIKIFAVGIGSRSGDLVPDIGENQQAGGYVKDRDGKYVTSRLDEDLLSKLAAKTGGGYLRADAQNFGVEAIQAALAGLKRTENEARLVRQYDEVFEVLLLPAFLLLLLEACLGERQRKLATRGNGAAALLLAALVPFLGAWSPLERNNRAVESGNASLKAGKAEEALAAYDKAVAGSPNDAGVHFNRGNALFALSRFEEAGNEFLRATQSAAPALRPAAFYNLGNSYFKNDKFDDAIAAYRHSLALDPANERAKWNLELAMQKKKEAEEKQKNQDDKKDQDKKDQDKKDQDKKDQDKKDQDKKDQDRKDQDKQKQEEDKQKQEEDKQKQEEDKQKQEKDKQKQEEQQQEENKQEQQQKQPQDRAEEKTPEMREIDAVLDNLERSPKDLEKMRARLRAVRRAPPVKDW